MAKKKRGKYGAKRTTIDGIKFDSMMESDYYIKLKEDLKDKKIKNFELQPEFVLQEAFILVEGEAIVRSDERFDKLKRKHKAPTNRGIKYISDFKVTYNDNSVKIIDVKGKETPVFNMKRKMFDYQNPGLKLQLVKKYRNEWHDLDVLKKEQSKARAARKKAKAKK